MRRACALHLIINDGLPLLHELHRTCIGLRDLSQSTGSTSPQNMLLIRGHGCAAFNNVPMAEICQLSDRRT